MEQKRLDRRNLLVIGAVILLIAVVAIVAAAQKRELNPTLGTLEADPTATPVVTEGPMSSPDVTAEPEATAEADPTAVPELTGTAPEATNIPANAYLVVTVAGSMYEPIPLYGESRYTIRRDEMVNVIEVTADSIKMHEASCDNQDCVLQGTVSLENREGRVLQNMIICLPNEVMLELYTPEEIEALLLSMLGSAGEGNDE